jgi:hypothetical protein
MIIFDWGRQLMPGSILGDAGSTSQKRDILWCENFTKDSEQVPFQWTVCKLYQS